MLPCSSATVLGGESWVYRATGRLPTHTTSMYASAKTSRSTMKLRTSWRMFCCGLQNANRLPAAARSPACRDVLVPRLVVAGPVGDQAARGDRPGDRLDRCPRPRTRDVRLIQLPHEGLAVGLGGRAHADL